jgi:transcriptional regulator with XRE-family HTH domain
MVHAGSAVAGWSVRPGTVEAPDSLGGSAVTVLRERIGEVLREVRMRQGRTLRQISNEAQVSLGYISEIERGQKEPSSELLAAVCAALDVPLSVILLEVSARLAADERAEAIAVSIDNVADVTIARPSDVSVAA